MLLVISSLISTTAAAEEKIYPCTADDIRHCNLLEAKNKLLESEKKILEDQNKKLEKLLLEKPPGEGGISIEVVIPLVVVPTVMAFVVGGYLGMKL